MAYFYGVYPENVEFESALNLIRFFAEPDFYRRTHITIRGPYTKRLSESLEKQIEHEFSKSGRRLNIVGVGSFFISTERSSQNTVILKCELDGADRIWRKPDFSDGMPHITLYDGRSRKFALALRHTLNQYNWMFWTKTTPIQILEKKRDPREYLQIYFQKSQNICRDVFGNEVDIINFDLNSDLERIYLINKVCRFIDEVILKGRSYLY